MRYEKVKERSDLVRDKQTNAILNVDNDSLKAYKNRKKHMNKINDLEDKVNGLEEKMDTVISLLQQSINSK